MVAPAADDVQMTIIECVSFGDRSRDIRVILRADRVFDRHHDCWISRSVGEDVEHHELVGAEPSAEGFYPREGWVELIFVGRGRIEADKERTAALKQLIPAMQQGVAIATTVRKRAIVLHRIEIELLQLAELQVQGADDLGILRVTYVVFYEVASN